MIEKVFIVPHTHTDLGYTADVDTVLARHAEMLSTLLGLCTHGHGPWPADRYRWTIESAVILRHWWERAAGDDRDALLALLRSGRWELAALETQLLTGIADPVELKASIAWACGLGRDQGFPVRTVMLNDLGGFARGLPSAVCGAGIRYAVLGCGGFRVLTPMAGLPSLFRWEAPDGASLLLWHLGISADLDPRIWEGLPAQYGFGNSYVIHPTRDACSDEAHDDDPEKLRFSVQKMDEAYRRLEADLERRGYPYRYLMLQASGDNRGMDPQLPRWIEQWNRNTDRPTICAATATEFFDAMVEAYDDDFPALKGDLHDSCSMLAADNTRGFATYRNNARTISLIQDMGSAAAGTEADLAEAGRWQLWFSDHTFGLSTWDPDTNGRIALDQSCITDPTPAIRRLIDSWEVKNDYVGRAADILETCKARLAVDADVTVFAPSEAPTTVVAALPPGCHPLEDADTTVQAGRDCTWVQWRGLSAGRPGRARLGGSVATVVDRQAPVTALVGDSWHVAFDDASGRLLEPGAGSAVDHMFGRTGEASAGDLIVFDVDDMDERAALGAVRHPPRLTARPLAWTGCERTAHGDLVSEITRVGVIACPESDQHVEQRWRLYHDSGVLEIDTLWHKVPRVRWEACYLALPLDFRDPDVLVHQGLTTARVGHEELPGCHRDQYCAQDWIAVRDEARTLLITPLEAGLVDVDAVRFLQFLTEPISPRTGSLFFLLSHNCWPTNAPCWQGGPLRFRVRMKRCAPDASLRQLTEQGRGLARGALVVGCSADTMAQ